MKLTKQRFYQDVAHVLEPHRWLVMPGPSEFSLLCAKREGDFILSLAFYESNLHRDRMTAEFALGHHASLMKFPDAPHAWSRVGRWLTSEERAQLLDPSFCGAGVVDAWWTGRTSENVARIAEAVRLATPRFLAQPGLTEEIAKSERHRAYAEKLRTIARAPVPADLRGELPPSTWIDVAATLTTAPPKKRPAIAARWAADAWRVFRILGLDPGSTT